MKRKAVTFLAALLCAAPLHAARATLMTGRYPARNGAYRTASGRCMLHADETTMANIFADAGYVTGMVRKRPKRCCRCSVS